MDELDTNACIRKVIDNVLTEYIQVFPILNFVNPEFCISENIARDYLRYRPNTLDSFSISYDKLNQYNGLVISPNAIDGRFTILLNRYYIEACLEKQESDLLGTIAHETTHVQDYFEYAHIISATDYDTVDKDRMFWLWSEMNARARGSYFARKAYFCGTERDKIPSQNIDRYELPEHWKRTLAYCNSTNDMYLQAYSIAQYLGRLYTLQKLSPFYFTDMWVQAHLGNEKWMSDWYFFFQKHPALSLAAPHFEEMRDILRQNFDGI